MKYHSAYITVSEWEEHVLHNSVQDRKYVVIEQIVCFLLIHVHVLLKSETTFWQ